MITRTMSKLVLAVSLCVASALLVGCQTDNGNGMYGDGYNGARMNTSNNPNDMQRSNNINNMDNNTQPGNGRPDNGSNSKGTGGSTGNGR